MPVLNRAGAADVAERSTGNCVKPPEVGAIRRDAPFIPASTDDGFHAVKSAGGKPREALKERAKVS